MVELLKINLNPIKMRQETFQQMRDRISKPFNSPLNKLSVRDKNSLDFRWRDKNGNFTGLKNLDTNHLKSISKTIEFAPGDSFAGKKKLDWYQAISYEMQFRNKVSDTVIWTISKLGKGIKEQI